MPPESLSQAIQRLVDRGFTHDLDARHGRLRDLTTGDSYDPALLGVDEVVRFEGDSDPDEQAVLFAVLSPKGDALGTWAVAFGPATPPEDGEVVRRLGEAPGSSRGYPGARARR